MTTKDHPDKRIVMNYIGKNRWEIELDGVVTRRDIRKLQRVLLVEFTKAERKRIVAKLKKDHQRLTPPTSEPTAEAPPILTPSGNSIVYRPGAKTP